MGNGAILLCAGFDRVCPQKLSRCFSFFSDSSLNMLLKSEARRSYSGDCVTINPDGMINLPQPLRGGGRRPPGGDD